MTEEYTEEQRKKMIRICYIIIVILVMAMIVTVYLSNKHQRQDCDSFNLSYRSGLILGACQNISQDIVHLYYVDKIDGKKYLREMR